MKSISQITLFALFIFSCTSNTEQAMESPTLSATEILAKCISHYDPGNSWDSYSGEVHLNTIFHDNTGEEILEIDNSSGFYQSTRLDTEEKIIRGISNGECITKIGDNDQISEQQIQEYGLSCDNIKMMSEHHKCHFGFILNMKNAGLTLEEGVSDEEFNGYDCHVITYAGNENDVVSNYYLGTGKLYIDKNNFSLRGRTIDHPDFPARKMIYTGEVKVGSISMPEVVVYYDDSQQFTFIDIFRTN